MGPIRERERVRCITYVFIYRCIYYIYLYIHMYNIIIHILQYTQLGLQDTLSEYILPYIYGLLSFQMNPNVIEDLVQFLSFVNF